MVLFDVLVCVYGTCFYTPILLFLNKVNRTEPCASRCKRCTGNSCSFSLDCTSNGAV